MQVKQETISEKKNLVAVVDENDLVIAAAVFDDDKTAAQVNYTISTLMKRTGLITSDESISPPCVSFNEICDIVRDNEESIAITKIGALTFSRTNKTS